MSMFEERSPLVAPRSVPDLERGPALQCKGLASTSLPLRQPHAYFYHLEVYMAQILYC